MCKMNEYIFVGRIANTNDRDTCFYMESKYHIDIVGHIILHGACYCGFYNEILEEIEKDNVESFLTRDELLDLFKNGKYEDKYNYYVKELTCADALEFKNKIMEDEKEIMKDENDLDDDDIEEILNVYNLDYTDRAIIGYVYHDYYELADEYVENVFGSNVDDYIKSYIDYEQMGQDMVSEDYECRFVVLKDGRIVELAY